MDQLRRVHALTYVVYRQNLENMGSNQYDMPHTGIHNRQTGGQEVDDSTVTNEWLLPLWNLHIVTVTLN